MAIVRWEPAQEMATLQNEVNRLFSSFFDAPSAPTGIRRWIPPMDLVEREDHFVLCADLPGLSESDVSIEVDDNTLTISGERHSAHESTEGGVHRVERATGTFRRSITLPEGTDADRIEATFDKGVLEVRIPKPEERQPRKVSITARPADVEAQAPAQDAAGEDTAA